MKIAIMLLFSLGPFQHSFAMQTNSEVYVYEEKLTPEEATAKIGQFLNESVDQKLEAMNVLLAYPKQIDSTPFLSKIQKIANHEKSYPEIDKLSKASKGQEEITPVTLTAEQSQEVNRLTLQSLAICVLSVANPGSMSPLLARLSASGSPSLELIVKYVSQTLEHLDHTRTKDINLATKSGQELSLALNQIYHGSIPYSKDIGDILFRKYQSEQLSFSDKAIVLSILQLHEYEGIEEIIAGLPNSKVPGDDDLPKVISDLVNDPSASKTEIKDSEDGSVDTPQ